MFFIRSAFWLSLAFVLIAPQGVNIGAVVATAKNEAMAAGVKAGQDLIVSQIMAEASAVTSPTLEFPTTPSIDLPMQDSPKSAVPFPRPRPHWMG